MICSLKADERSKSLLLGANFSKFESETAQLEGRSTETMGTTEYLVDKAERRGIEKGIDKGIQKERARAKRLIEQERAKAEQERTKAYAEKLKSALEFKKMGIPVADIAKGLQLSIEEVEKL